MLVPTRVCFFVLNQNGFSSDSQSKSGDLNKIHVQLEGGGDCFSQTFLGKKKRSTQINMFIVEDE